MDIMDNSWPYECDVGLDGSLAEGDTWALFEGTESINDDWLPLVFSPPPTYPENGVDEVQHIQNQFPVSPESSRCQQSVLEPLIEVGVSKTPDEPVRPDLCKSAVATVTLVKPPKGWKAPVPRLKAENKLGKLNCCVVNCNNSPEKCVGRGIKFHSFPGRAYEKERKEMWIAALKRINSDGSAWQPTKYSKVCSEHFVGGVVSNIATHPAYVPTIFPPTSSKIPDHEENPPSINNV